MAHLFIAVAATLLSKEAREIERERDRALTGALGQGFRNPRFFESDEFKNSTGSLVIIVGDALCNSGGCFKTVGPLPILWWEPIALQAPPVQRTGSRAKFRDCGALSM